MCDYSLMVIPNRLAEEGEELVTHRFWTGSLGFASPLDLCKAALPLGRRLVFWSRPHENPFYPPETNGIMYFKLRKTNTRAICIPPGTRLILQDIPQSLQRDLEVGPTEEVTFTQFTAAANTFRNAVRFRNGREVLLQELREGQRVNVLSLSSGQAFEPVQEGREVLLRRR